MLPNQNRQAEIVIEEIPSFTYQVQAEKRIVQGDVDGLLAIRQAIEKLLETKQYHHVIYDGNYGIYLTDLWGKAKSYVIPELKKRIEEAILADDRIVSVSDFRFSGERSSITVQFLVETRQGVLEMEKKVKL